MRSLWLSLGLLFVPLLLASPLKAQVGPPCCQPEGEFQHPPDPHNLSPILVPAEVRRPDERALEAAAEAPLDNQVSRSNAVAAPSRERGQEVQPEREPELAQIERPAPADLIYLPPCCQREGEHAPDRDLEKKPSPVLIGAKVEKRDKRALETAVELPIPAKEPLVPAIGIPLTAQRGVSEPVYRPETVDELARWLSGLETDARLIGPTLLLLLAIGLWMRRAQRRQKHSEYQPARPRPGFPEDWLKSDVAPVTYLKSQSIAAKERETLSA